MNLDDVYQNTAGALFTLVDILDDGRMIFTNESNTSDVVLKKLPKSWKKVSD